jgi:sugar-phosphatase
MAGALLFDLDGVLVDSRRNVERHWTRWARRRGLDPREVLAVVHRQRSLDTVRALAPGLAAEPEARELDEAQARDTSGIVPADGAGELLGALEETPWAVVTSCSRHLAERRLRAAGLPLPSVIVGAEAVARGKPDPEGFLRAARELGVPPRACTVLEDAPTGVEAARGAGMRVIALATTHDPAELEHADDVVSTLREAARLVLGASSRSATRRSPS